MGLKKSGEKTNNWSGYSLAIDRSLTSDTTSGYMSQHQRLIISNKFKKTTPAASIVIILKTYEKIDYWMPGV